MNNWLPAGQVPELSMAFAAATPPPLPNSSVQQRSSTTPVGTAPSTLESMIISPTQRQFIEALLYMEKKSDAVYGDKRLTELQRKPLRDSLPKERIERMKYALNGNSKVTDWVGTVERVTESNDGNRVLSVKIHDRLRLSSYVDDGARSYVMSRAFISKSSPIYNGLASLSLGDIIYFSGEFFPGVNESFDNDARFRIQGGDEVRTTPGHEPGTLGAFYFRFTSIRNSSNVAIASDTSPSNSSLEFNDTAIGNNSDPAYTPFDFGDDQNNSAYNNDPSQSQPNGNTSTAKKVLTGVAGAALNQLFGR